MSSPKERIARLREMMLSKGWDAVVITGTDPHGSEYPALRWKQVEWISGFTGEAGDIVITQDHAGLWTDTRYFIQAERQLAGSGVVLHKTRVPDEVLIPQWLREEMPADAIIAVDGPCFEASGIGPLDPSFEVVGVQDLLDPLWTDRPGIPQTSLYEVECGESRAEKIEWIRAELSRRGSTSIFLKALDEIAWTLNVRASDIEYNPYAISYLYISEAEVKWFVLREEVDDPASEKILSALASEGIEILPYCEAEGESYDYSGPSFIAGRKACKNEFEIEGMRRAHVRDGLAVERFLFWLERSLDAGRQITEWDAAVQLGRLRAESPEYLGDSFETISAYGPGAALPHYITPCCGAPLIEPRGLYLCDSGAHYTDGTTDITRTVPLGDCTPLEREDYTLVLKGHIALARAVFPEGTPGCRIDCLAREPLWEARRNFGHGTGHGVGFVLGVHEGPQDVRQNLNPEPLRPGMVLSDEPGIYREGEHGVRHENLLLCVRDSENEFGRWLRFEPLTLCHFDTSALDLTQLSQPEIDWLNEYNSRVYDVLAPLLPEEVAAWLREKTLAV